jgi:predicted transcriptional regulator
MPRRERDAIFGSLLLAIDEASVAGRGVTSVAAKANLPHDRMAAYLRELSAAGLVTVDRRPSLTTQGREALRTYRDWSAMLQRFGLD